MATWVLLNDTTQEDAAPILFVNTHFDHRGQQAREESAKLIRQRIEKLTAIADNPNVIVTGDFNTPEASAPYRAFLDDNQHLRDTYRVHVATGGDNEGTFNGFRGRMQGGRIDWILASPRLQVLEASINRTHDNDQYPSDHFPVTAVLQRSE